MRCAGKRCEFERHEPSGYGAGGAEGVADGGSVVAGVAESAASCGAEITGAVPEDGSSTSTFRSSGDSSEPAGGLGVSPPQPAAVAAVRNIAIATYAAQCRDHAIGRSKKLVSLDIGRMACWVEFELTGRVSSLSSCC
jgi:hypothetical protein